MCVVCHLVAYIFLQHGYLQTTSMKNSKNTHTNTPCLAANAEDSRTNIFEGSNDTTTQWMIETKY